jgi:hypothetical protein
MRAKDIPVGGRFTLCHRDTVYTRVKPKFWLPSMFEWSRGRGVDTPSNEHVLAVDSDYNLIAIHPDNGVVEL